MDGEPGMVCEEGDKTPAANCPCWTPTLRGPSEDILGRPCHHDVTPDTPLFDTECHIRRERGMVSNETAN